MLRYSLRNFCTPQLAITARTQNINQPKYLNSLHIYKYSLIFKPKLFDR